MLVFIESLMSKLQTLPILPVLYIFQRWFFLFRFTGDSVELGIIRAGEFMKVQAILKPRVHLV